VRAASRLDAVIAGAIALMVIAFACGSSSVASVKHAGGGLRWVLLVALLALGAWACRARGIRPPLRPVALAGWLLAIAFLSAAWSVDPRLTIERAGSLAILFAAALLVTAAVAVETIFAGLLAGAAAVGVLGLLVLAVDHSAGVQEGSTGVPTRFRGLGESANTSALLFGVALPLTVWLALRGPRRLSIAAVAAFALLDGSIVAAGSRGALAGGFAGAIVAALVVPRAWRLRLVAAGALAALFVVSFFVGTIPKPLSHTPAVHRALPASHPKPGFIDANQVFPLNDDVGRPAPGSGESFVPRQAFGSSGRTQAWRGALHQVAQRPTVGYGFGTEPDVFVNRYHLFAGGVPENSYIGLLLQLGAIGLASFLALMCVWLARGLLALRTADRAVLGAAGAVVVAGLVAAVVQSYVVSVGDIATATFWIAAFAVATHARPLS
jgi:O-antigen ligase